MLIEYDEKKSKFVISCSFEHNNLVCSLPDVKFRRHDRRWVAPVLKRNVMFMAEHLNNERLFSPPAWAKFNEKLASLNNMLTDIRSDWPEWYQFKTPPLAHQDKYLRKFFPLDEAAILFEQGLGKTFTSINLATAWRMTGQIDSVLVICPSSIKLVWPDELNKHCPIDRQTHVITPSRKSLAFKFINNKTDFQWMIVGIESLSQGSAYDLVRDFLLSRKTAVIIDESSTIKNPDKIRTDRCISFFNQSKKRVILSGTAITNGLENFYTQFQFLNPDIIGFDSFYTFRAHFCHIQNINVSEDRTVPKIVGYKNMDEFLNLVSPYTARVEKKDALDLPEKIFSDRLVTMNPTQKKAYMDMKNELFSEMEGQEYEVKTILEQLLRLQQITSGFYPHDDGVKVVPRPIPGKNPKLTELMATLEDISGKVIIWCQWRADLGLIAGELSKKEIRYVEFHGGCDDDEKVRAVHNFRGDPDCKVFLATRAAAYGLNLTECSTAIYYSQGYSLEQYLQSQDRIHRIGQKNKRGCNYIHLLCDKTIDKKIIQALRTKAEVADAVYSLIKD